MVENNLSNYIFFYRHLHVYIHIYQYFRSVLSCRADDFRAYVYYISSKDKYIILYINKIGKSIYI